MEKPVSGIQRQFLVNSELYPESSAYHVVSLVRIAGSLETERLRGAWARVFDAAGIVRCRVTGDSPPRMVEDPSCALPWTENSGSETEVRAACRLEAERPFDLERSLPVRVTLYRCSSDLHFFCLIQHHVVTDLFSRELLLSAIARCYDDPEYRPVFESYDAYAKTEPADAEDPAFKRSLSLWRGAIPDGLETLRLPASKFPREPFSGKGNQLAWSLDRDLEAPFAALAEEGRAAFVWLLTAYACTLSRLSGQKAFALAVPFTNRQAVADRPVLGPCVNVLPVFVNLRPEETFLSLYDALRAEMLRCHRLQGLPFLEVARLLPTDGDPLRPRALQAGFTREPPTNLPLRGLTCEPEPVERSGAQMDLFFTWWESGTGLKGSWEYNGGSFCAGDCAAWMDAFNRALAASFREPGAKISAISLADPDSVRRFARGPTVDDYPLHESVAAGLRRSYLAHSALTALVFRGISVSYGEFSGAVRKIAAFARETAGSSGRVVVCCERSPELVMALHGIVQSGNAYVPMGVEWPDGRIRDIVEDIQPSLILTQDRFLSRFGSVPCPAASVEEILYRRAEGDGPSWPSLESGGDDLFYVLYTSGTTGKPKGVAVPNRGIANHLAWMQETFPLERGERCLLKTAYTFDVSVWELFWPFRAGACLVVADEEQPKDPREILELCRAGGVQRLNFVPSLLERFLDQDGLESLTALRRVNCIGEALPVGLAERFLGIFPRVELHNLYGPTEASVSVSWWPCTGAESARGTVPIGFPMANTQLYVVDEAMNPCPPLVKGELLIGGDCLASGYWNREELTAERFVQNPFGSGKLYRSGDWCRYALDGAIEYVERKDTQTKFRGIRLELGEIESHLSALPGVERSAVIKGRDQNGQECLIAYYREADGASLSRDVLRRELRRHLPDALIPAHFLRLESFPLNDNGKTDRKALADVVPSGAPAAVREVSFLSGSELAVARLWERAIGAAPSDGDTNFFDSGGDSMSLLALRSLMERELGVSLKVAELFGAPSIREMASLVDSRRIAPSGGAPVRGDAAAVRAERRRLSLGARVRKPGDR